jgi:hypothetical protein
MHTLTSAGASAVAPMTALSNAAPHESVGGRTYLSASDTGNMSRWQQLVGPVTYQAPREQIRSAMLALLA